MDQSDMYHEGRLSCCYLGTLQVDLSIVGYTESGWIIGVYEAELSACLQETTTTTKKSEFTWKKNIPFSKVCWIARRSLYTAGTLEIHDFLCTSWGSSQSESVGALHRCEAGFYQLPSEWSLNKGTRSFPLSWKAPDLGPKTRATGPVLFILPLLWLVSQVLFLYKTVPYLCHLN